MRVHKSQQVPTDVSGTRADQLKQKGAGKKNIPFKQDAGSPGKTVHHRQVHIPGVSPPVLAAQGVDRQEICATLWSHWSGKTREDIKKCYSAIEKVNSSALLAIEKLLDDTRQVTACQVPGVLILSKKSCLKKKYLVNFHAGSRLC